MAYVKATTKTLIVNEKNELLILKIGVHTKRPERSFTLDLPGGFIDDGEFERDGAIREVKEETSIDLMHEDLDLIWAETDYIKDRQVSFTHLFYLIKLNATPEVKISWEHESFEWVSINDAATKFVDRPRFKKIVEYTQDIQLL